MTRYNYTNPYSFMDDLKNYIFSKKYFYHMIVYVFYQK